MQIPNFSLVFKPDKFDTDLGRKLMLTWIASISGLWPRDPRMFPREQGLALLASEGELQRPTASISSIPWQCPQRPNGVQQHSSPHFSHIIVPCSSTGSTANCFRSAESATSSITGSPPRLEPDLQ